jgi:hypothetical protein
MKKEEIKSLSPNDIVEFVHSGITAIVRNVDSNNKLVTLEVPQTMSSPAESYTTTPTPEKRWPHLPVEEVADARPPALLLEAQKTTVICAWADLLNATKV